MVRLINGINAFPTRYWRKGHLDDFEPLTTETMIEKHLEHNDVCPPCLLQCIKHNVIREGPHAGLEIDGPEYETLYVFGGLCEIVDFAEVMRLNDICDRLGADTMTAGNLCALAIEASRRGLIDAGSTSATPTASPRSWSRCACATARSETCSPRACSRSNANSVSRALPST